MTFGSMMINIMFFDNTEEEKLVDAFGAVGPVSIKTWGEQNALNERFIAFGKQLQIKGSAVDLDLEDLVKALQMIRRFTRTGEAVLEKEGKRYGFEYNDLTCRWAMFVEIGEEREYRNWTVETVQFLFFGLFNSCI